MNELIERLRPCPFCGRDANVFEGSGKFYATCVNVECYCALGESYDRDAMPDHCFDSEEAAAAAWNRRALTPPGGGVIAQRLRWISEARNDENADLDSLCTYADQALSALEAAPSVSPATGEAVAWQPRRTDDVLERIPNASEYLFAIYPTEEAARLHGGGQVRPLYASPPTSPPEPPTAPSPSGGAE